jgi:hypothetical protein
MNNIFFIAARFYRKPNQNSAVRGCVICKQDAAFHKRVYMSEHLKSFVGFLHFVVKDAAIKAA